MLVDHQPKSGDKCSKVCFPLTNVVQQCCNDHAAFIQGLKTASGSNLDSFLRQETLLYIVSLFSAEALGKGLETEQIPTLTSIQRKSNTPMSAACGLSAEE